MTDLEKRLDDLKQANRQKEAALRKEIAKKKRQEHDALVKAVGEMAIKAFPKCKTPEEFDRSFKLIIAKRDAIKLQPPKD